MKIKRASFWFTLAASAAVAMAVDWLAQSPTAHAQTCAPPHQSTPGFTGAGGNLFGRAAAQWDAFFAAKVDANNGTLCNPTILGTLSINAAIIINSLGYVPLNRTGANATSPFYIDSPTGFGVTRGVAPVGQLEILSGDEAPLTVSRSTGVVGSEDGAKFRMRDSAAAYAEYGAVHARILTNNAGSNSGVLVLYAAKNGTSTSYGRVGNGGTCLAEGGVFCASNAPPTDGLVTKGPQQVGAVAFASLPTCVSGLEGSRVAITDSNTATPNATIAGGGTNHVNGYCNATAWKVN